MRKVKITIPEAAHDGVRRTLQERFTCDLHTCRLSGRGQGRAGASRVGKNVPDPSATLVLVLRVEEDQLRSLFESVDSVMATVRPGHWEMTSSPAACFGQTGTRGSSQRLAPAQGKYLRA